MTSILIRVMSYLAVHFFLYVFVFRFRREFFQEKVIFFYHFFSFMSLSVLLLLGGQRLEVFTAAVSLHGIYSLTFLEFWSLSDGGYSLRILDALDSQAAHGKGVPDLTALQNLGQNKKQNRIRGLLKMGLLSEGSGKFFLTGSGKAFVTFLALVVWPSNPKAR